MSEERLVPKLRFINEPWESKKLGKLCKITMGQSPSSSNYTENESDTVLIQGNADLINGKVVPRIYTTEVTKTAVPGDIILTVRAPVGDLAINEFNSCIGRGVCSIEGNKFIYYFLQSLKDKHVWERLSQGSTFESINSNDIQNLKVNIPSEKTQKSISNFLTLIDAKMEMLEKKYGSYIKFKKYLMQQIFAQKLRFKSDNGENFDEWKERKLSEFLTEHKLKSTGNEEVYSVSVHKGLVNQIEHLGRAFSAPDTSKYNLVKPGDIVYTKSPTGDFPLGIIKQSRVDKNVIVSPLYGVFTPETYDLGYILNDYFESNVNTHNYLHPIVQKGAKNTMNITNKTFLSKSLLVPTDKNEQHKIAECLMKFNESIRLIEIQKDQVEDFKHGLLQQMFV